MKHPKPGKQWNIPNLFLVSLTSSVGAAFLDFKNGFGLKENHPFRTISGYNQNKDLLQIDVCFLTSYLLYVVPDLKLEWCFFHKMEFLETHTCYCPHWKQSVTYGFFNTNTYHRYIPPSFHCTSTLARLRWIALVFFATPCVQHAEKYRSSQRDLGFTDVCGKCSSIDGEGYVLRIYIYIYIFWNI